LFYTLTQGLQQYEKREFVAISKPSLGLGEFDGASSHDEIVTHQPVLNEE